MRSISLGLTLLGFWLALSGHYTPFLLAVGAACVVLCVWVANQMDVVDDEGQPLAFYARAPAYWGWLWVEIFKSAISVSRHVWSPRIGISATMTRVRAGQEGSVGLATYANSITLTPGTITTGVKDNILTVHALTLDGAKDVEAGGMDRMVCWFEGSEGNK